MSIRERLVPALQAALVHLGGSVLVAGLSAALVFGLWFPAPYDELAGGLFLWALIAVVDVVCGPLLTLIVFDRSKPRGELVRDIGFIALLQLAALGYGLYSVAQARPIYLAYEGDRFRLVSMADVDAGKLGEAPPELRSPGYGGPRLLGAKLTESSDPAFQHSILLSIQGLPPAFRPSRWVAYESLLPQLHDALQPVAILKATHPDAATRIDQALNQHGLTEESAGFLPLNAAKADPLDWVVIVQRDHGIPKVFLPLDGW